MRALVTGAAGFIGSRLCRLLSNEGHEVRALVRPGRETGHIAEWAKDIRTGDLTRPETIEGLAEGVDTVFHLAARVVDWGRRDQFYSVILDGARHVLEESVGRAERFVFVSSIAACGLGRHLKGQREDDPVRKSGVPYNDAKMDGEELVRSYHGRQGLSCVIVRPSNVIGPGSVWVADVARRFQRSGVPLLDGGVHSASLVDLSNLADGILLAGTLPRAAGGTYHLRDDWDVTWKRYLTDLGAMVGRKPGPNIPFRLAWSAGAALEFLMTPLGLRPPLTRLAAGVLGRDNDVDTSKTKEELGWRTRVSYEDSMNEIKAWVEKNIL